MKVLFVDDEPDLLELARIYLERESSRLDIQTANSAEEGLAMIDETKFDVIISDYDMPEMDGLDFFKKLRKQGKDIHFIVFTGSGAENLEEKAEEAGVDGYLTKGGDPKEKFSKLADSVINGKEKQST